MERVRDVAGGEHVGGAGPQVLVDHDPVVDLEPGGLGEPRVGRDADADDHRVARDRLAAGQPHGAAPARRPRCPRRAAPVTDAHAVPRRAGRRTSRRARRRARHAVGCRRARRAPPRRRGCAPPPRPRSRSSPRRSTTTVPRRANAARSASLSAQRTQRVHAVEVDPGDRRAARHGAGRQQQPVVIQRPPVGQAPGGARRRRRAVAATPVSSSMSLLGVELARVHERLLARAPTRAGSPSTAAAARTAARTRRRSAPRVRRSPPRAASPPPWRRPGRRPRSQRSRSREH